MTVTILNIVSPIYLTFIALILPPVIPLRICLAGYSSEQSFTDAKDIIQYEQLQVLTKATLTWFQAVSGFEVREYRQTHAVRLFSNSLKSSFDNRSKKGGQFGAAAKQFGKEVCM